MGKRIKTDKKEKAVVQTDSGKEEESLTVLQKKKNAKKLKK